jgi:hypothetical protein
MSEATTGEKSFEVPGEPGVYWCARHSKVKTRLRCGRCETPICTKCTKFGPTGARCPACASNRGLHIYKVSPGQYAAAIAVSLVLGIVSGIVASVAGLFALFYAPVAGTLIGKAISAVTGHKRGPILASIAAGGIVLGALITALPSLLVAFVVANNPAVRESDPTALITYGASPLFLLLYLALAVPSVWYWLR